MVSGNAGTRLMCDVHEDEGEADSKDYATKTRRSCWVIISENISKWDILQVTSTSDKMHVKIWTRNTRNNHVARFALVR